MYSPRIREDLIPRLYRIAKARRIPMTRFVNGIVERELDAIERAVDRTNRVCEEGSSFRPEGSQCRAPPMRDSQTI